MLKNLKISIIKNLEYFKNVSWRNFNDRKNKFLKIGRNKGFIII
jgi:acetyl-CoA carboxylase carboxyl transferase subunit alpha